MNNTVLNVDKISKIYRLYHRHSDRIREIVIPRRKCHQDFYALDGVSFKLPRGHTLGVVGRNGSGKSTLLKILAGILSPSSGMVEISGRVAALLELGAGFNPLMTGIDNVYFNGTIMGFTRREMHKRLDAIADFAGIGDYMDQPVRTYSSGMFVRLAFAVAISVDPDILLVDEALAVGDMNFQAKCFRKLAGFREAGKTVVFVTHALDTVIRFCDRAIVLEKGRLVADAEPKKAVDEYKQIMAESTAFAPESGIAPETLSYGNQQAKIVGCGLFDDKARPACLLENGKNFTITMQVQFQADIANPVFAYTIKDLKGLEVTGTNTKFKKQPPQTYRKGDLAEVKFEQVLNMQAGSYALSLGCVGSNESGLTVYHRLYDAVLFEVASSLPMVGLYDLETNITVNRI